MANVIVSIVSSHRLVSFCPSVFSPSQADTMHSSCQFVHFYYMYISTNNIMGVFKFIEIIPY